MANWIPLECEPVPSGLSFDVWVDRCGGKTGYRIADCFLSDGETYLLNRATEDVVLEKLMDVITDDDVITHWSIPEGPKVWQSAKYYEKAKIEHAAMASERKEYLKND